MTNIFEIPNDYRKGKSVHEVISEWKEICYDEPQDSHIAIQLDIWEMRQVIAYIHNIEQPK